MKITHKAAALFSLAALLPAAAQMEINPDHFTEQTASIAFLSQQVADVGSLQEKVKAYQDQLRVEFELVENLRQDAISAGIQGDGAQAYIDVYRDEQLNAERMRVTLAPQIEQARATLAILTGKGSQALL
jgi:hypothetical protein